MGGGGLPTSGQQACTQLHLCKQCVHTLTRCSRKWGCTCSPAVSAAQLQSPHGPLVGCGPQVGHPWTRRPPTNLINHNPWFLTTQLYEQFSLWVTTTEYIFMGLKPGFFCGLIWTQPAMHMFQEGKEVVGKLYEGSTFLALLYNTRRWWSYFHGQSVGSPERVAVSNDEGTRFLVF